MKEYIKVDTDEQLKAVKEKITVADMTRMAVDDLVWLGRVAINGVNIQQQQTQEKYRTDLVPNIFPNGYDEVQVNEGVENYYVDKQKYPPNPAKAREVCAEIARELLEGTNVDDKNYLEKVLNESQNFDLRIGVAEALLNLSTPQNKANVEGAIIKIDLDGTAMEEIDEKIYKPLVEKLEKESNKYDAHAGNVDKTSKKAALLDASIELKGGSSYKKKFENFQGKWPVVKAVISKNADVGAIKFIKNVGHILSLGLVSLITKGTLDFRKSHGKVASEKIDKIMATAPTPSSMRK